MHGQNLGLGCRGKVIFVTGARRGIGRAAALALAKDGAVVYAGMRNGATSNAAADTDIDATEGRLIPVRCDVTDPQQVSDAFALIQSATGRLDVLINNAGVIEPIGPIDAVDIDLWRSSLHANLFGAYLCTRHALASMKRQQHGVIVNVSSGAAHRPIEGWSAYCVAKAGLAMLTRSTDHECRAHGVRTFGLIPGLVDTDMQATIRASGINPVSARPRKDLESPEIVAQRVVWLCANAPESLSGTEIDIKDIPPSPRS